LEINVMKMIPLQALVVLLLGTTLAQIPSPPNSTRIWSGEGLNFWTGDISPDGRFFSDINWETGDFQLLDLSTGQIETVNGVGYDTGRYAWSSSFSSDGRRIALSCFVMAAGSHELRIKDLDGGDWRTLVQASQDRYSIDPVDWTPSDKEIVVVTKLPDNTRQLASVSVEDGSIRVIKKLGWQTPGGGHDQAYPHAMVSPDGRFIAYDYPPPNERTRDIYAVSVDGKSEHRIVWGRGSDRLLGWIPDGSGILFYSDRSGAPAIWRQGVRDGKPAGKPRLIRAGIRDLIPMGFTSEGYTYAQPLEAERIFTAAVDFANGSVIEHPKPIPDLPTRKILSADWSPDGSQYIYATQGAFPDPVETLVIHTSDGRPVRAITLPTGLHTSNGTLRWATPEKVYLAAYEKGLEGMFEVDLRRTTFTRIPTPKGIGWGSMKWFEVSPDGRTVYMIHPISGPNAENEVMALDVTSGDTRVIVTARSSPNSLALSNDGKELAYIVRDNANSTTELRVTPISDPSKSRTIYSAPLGRIRPPVAWLPDSSRLLFGADTALWSISVQGGEPIKVLPECCSSNDVRIHRDGRRIAFLAGSDRSEVWVMKVN
jgi:Tol biopolymer transport system component